MDDRKRKRPDEPMLPPDTGSGREILTQVVYAIEYLRSKDRPIPFDDIWNYLSLPPEQSKHRSALRKALIDHPKTEYTPGSHPTFRFRPIHNVRNGEELIAYLQQQTTAQGISVKELKDGWPSAIEEIDSLERKGQLLVTRNKKDNTPKMVWSNDPSLSIHIEDDFQNYWTKTKLPSNPSDMRLELEKAGLTPTSQVKEIVKVLPGKKEKRRVNRKAGRSTNTHMMGILKDYGFKK
ncbi:hypothetical protein K461DRAFT_278323 [Myriangium duriaei CBS 260.36]|uniref:TFIIE beta domain-containing protein n=1 Tax=Myriangium duriaei CBS 260.36 TaxID=1168546 RepID=A0A9P4J3P8_9PEZI|nr:hypothetical protein K461DRAFT_278323 [Myriangium duriaei CBS 260.36]